MMLRAGGGGLSSTLLPVDNSPLDQWDGAGQVVAVKGLPSVAPADTGVSAIVGNWHRGDKEIFCHVHACARGCAHYAGARAYRRVAD